MSRSDNLGSFIQVLDGDNQSDDGRLEIRYKGGSIHTVCRHCGDRMHEHEKTRVYPDDGPPGSYHYEYECT